MLQRMTSHASSRPQSYRIDSRLEAAVRPSQRPHVEPDDIPRRIVLAHDDGRAAASPRLASSAGVWRCWEPCPGGLRCVRGVDRVWPASDARRARTPSRPATRRSGGGVSPAIRWESGAPPSGGTRPVGQRRTSRMLSDMLGTGACHSRNMRAGGTADITASPAHPAMDVIPDARPRVPTERTHAAITAAFT
jgi:hypothetical protein